MAETPKQYKKRHDKYEAHALRQREHQAAEAQRVRTMPVTALIHEHELNCLYGSTRAAQTRAELKRRGQALT